MKAIDPESAEWYTPPEILNRVYAVFEGRVDVDPCCNPGVPVVRARTHYRREDNGLYRPWEGTVYMNPPYGRQIGKWTHKLVSEYLVRRVPAAVALLPVKSDTKWWADLMVHVPVWCAIKGRIRFQSPTGIKDTGTFASATVLLCRDPAYVDRFVDHFEDLGMLWGKYP